MSRIFWKTFTIISAKFLRDLTENFRSLKTNPNFTSDKVLQKQVRMLAAKSLTGPKTEKQDHGWCTYSTVITLLCRRNLSLFTLWRCWGTWWRISLTKLLKPKRYPKNTEPIWILRRKCQKLIDVSLFSQLCYETVRDYIDISLWLFPLYVDNTQVALFFWYHGYCFDFFFEILFIFLF